MKSVSLFAAALAVGSAVAAPSDTSIPPWADVKLAKRQSNAITGMLANALTAYGGKVADPPGAAPKRVELAPRVKADGAKTVKIRYGPYKVPNMGVKNFLGEEGALWNYPDRVAERPCPGECAIVGMNAGLEYPDGTNANVDTGMWLHHMVLFNIGAGRSDATCSFTPISLPHGIVGSWPGGSERLFSSGNERTHIILANLNATNVGYKLKANDKFALIVDFMNENMVDKVVYLTMTYDYVDATVAARYDDMKPVWFDVAQCLTSEWPPAYQQGKYTIPSAIWPANFEGDIIAAAGHLHDGGQAVTLEVDGKLVCDSKSSYGDSPEFIQKTAMGHSNGATEHISSMGMCTGETMGLKKLVKGQKWELKAAYDYGKNKGSLHGDGKQGNVMGIAIMFVRVPK